MSNAEPNPMVERVKRHVGLNQAERLDVLRALFPEAFAEDKVDWDKLRLALGDDLADGPERYSFTWAGKRDAIRLLQMPSRATLVPARDESLEWDTTKNAFIEGDNLEVLKLLLKPYYGRVKVIYIDPPYNTGKDFVYPDNYADPLDTYLRFTGQKDSEGNLQTSNTDTSGRFHSAWLSMMYPRLFLARQLLLDDGLVFVSIDDNEVHNLRMILNEIFGEENFVAQIAWKNVYGGGSKSKHVVPQHELILVFAKNKDAVGNIELPPSAEARKRYTEKDDKYAVRGPYFTQPLATTSMDERPNLRFPITFNGEEIWPEKQWQWSKDRVELALANDDLVIKKTGTGWSVRYKQYLNDESGQERGAKIFSVLNGPWSQEGTADIASLLGDGKIFPFPKPTSLIKHFIGCTWHQPEAIIVDFFAGSCATAQAVMEINNEIGGNRQYIMVQLPEATPKNSPARKAGYLNIADIGKERLRRVINRLKSDNTKSPTEEVETGSLGFRVFKLTQSNYKPWSGVEEQDFEEYAKQLEAFADPLVEGWKPEGVIYEVALKEGYGLGLSIAKLDEVKTNEVFRVADPDKKQSFVICLDAKLDDTTSRALKLGRDDLFVCRDSAITDQQAANLALQCRLKTV